MAFFKYNDKNVFYEEIGDGEPLLMLHGNSVSSNMYRDILPLYTDCFKVILIDFLGHGKSERIKEFPADFWYDEAMQAMTLLREKGYKKVNVVGTSGGAIAALNLALEAGDVVHKVIADSFEGENSLEIVATTIKEDREQSKQDQGAVAFWKVEHGEDWEDVVDHDTDVIIRHHQQIGRFYHKDLSDMAVPALLSASLKDEFADYVDFDEVYRMMTSKMADGKIHLFKQGGHPAMMSNAEEFSAIAKTFFLGS